MRFATAIATFGLLAGCAGHHDQTATNGPGDAHTPPVHTITCEATPIGSGEIDIGSLQFVAGAELTSSDARFGGLSGLDADAFGLLWTVSDQGIGMALVIESPEDVRCLRAGPMRNQSGGQPAGKSEVDAEGLVMDRGAAIVSFERNHRVVRTQALVQPAGLYGSANWILRAPIAFQADGYVADNGGAEALTMLENGVLLAGGERALFNGHHPVWRFEPSADLVKRFHDTGAPSFAIAKQDGFALTGFDTTPSGALLVLYRRYVPLVGNSNIIGWVEKDAIENAAEGAVIEPRELARLTPNGPLPVDNFEGVASLATPDGHTMIWIVADDNFNDTQRTLLYGFRFDEAQFMADLED